ncbi:MAG: TonB-dependent receptor [Bacteroidales bacterium]
MKKRLFCSLFSLFLYLCHGYAQTIEKVIIDGWYIGTLEEVLDRISKEKGLTFAFDRSYARKVKIDAPPFKRSVDNFLQYVVCQGNKLKYFIDDAQVIHIVEVWKQVEEKAIHKKDLGKVAATRHNLTFSGKVVDIENEESLPYVNLIVNETRAGSSTNADGLFALLNIPSDTSSITISYIGYKPQTLKLQPGMALAGHTIRLEPATELLSEVVILSDKQDLLQTNEQVGLIKMTPLKMNVLPSLGEKDIFRTFQLMPGISAANENSSGLYVRGGTPDQSLVLYDGIPIYNVQHLFGFYSAFNSNAIKDIQLYKGGFDAKYGGRLSSVVEITGKEGNNKKFGAMADISLMSANGFIEFPIGKKITFLAAGRRSWQSPLYETIFNQSSGQTSNTPAPDFGGGGMGAPGGFSQKNKTSDYQSYFYDVNAKLTYRPSIRDIISVSFYKGADDLDNSFNPSGNRGGASFSIDNSDQTAWGNTGASMKWSHNWNARLYSNMQFTYSDYFNDRDRTSTLPASLNASTITTTTESTAEHNRLHDYSGKLDMEYKLSAIQQILFGIQGSRTETTYALSENDTTTYLNNTINATVLSFYLQDKLSLMDTRMLITGGLRANYYSPTGKTYFEPRLTASYSINPTWKLKGSSGYYYQFAKKITREDIMQGNRDFWLMADGDQMPVGKSWQSVLGFSWETRNYLIDVEAYYKKLYDISEYSIRTVNMSQTGGGGMMGGGMHHNAQASTVYNNRFYSGNGYARGIDVLAQKKYGNYTGWISYTFGQVIHDFPDISATKYYAANDVTHELKLVNIYKWHNWDFSASWLFATGKPYTAPEGLYQLTLPDGTVKSYFTPSAKNGNRLAPYHRLDLAATYNFKITKRFPCSVNVSVFNLYNQKNVWYKEFQAVDTEIVETDINYLGITPNINFSIKF